MCILTHVGSHLYVCVWDRGIISSVLIMQMSAIIMKTHTGSEGRQRSKAAAGVGRCQDDVRY